MAIPVTCPGCHKRFSVSDKFAGKTGPCPKCKTPIRVPTKADEIKIEAPEDAKPDGLSPAGHLIVKPIVRRETKFHVVTAAWIIGAVVLTLGVTSVLGRAGTLVESPMLGLLGLFLVSPPLAVAGYSFLYNQEELQPYRGIACNFRGLVCGLLYAGLWVTFFWVIDKGVIAEAWSWVYVAPPFFVVGAFVAAGAFDFDFGTSFLHFSFYLMVTTFLRWLAGFGWVWEIVEEPLF